MMNQLRDLWNRFNNGQRLSLIAAIVAVAGGLWAFVHWNAESDFRPLYSNLSGEDAAQVLSKLRENGVDFRLADGGGTVKVPSSKVDEMRIQMAASGLPKSGRIGYELFDKTNFGASDFTEQINYHRAIEGELERSVMSLSEVEQARVHITFPKQSVFTESRQPAKASVLLKLRTGAKLSPQNVLAICHLTASAVEGLAAEAVSVLDMRGNLLNRPRSAALSDSEPSEAALEYRQKIERDLLLKINSTLEPLLGGEKFRAGVSADCDMTSGEQSEETFDPTRSVMVTEQKTEDASGVNAASGVPGTASNLPRPTSRPGTSGSGVTRRTDNVSYQTSRMVKHLRLPQGGVRRLSISLLVDHGVRWEGEGPKGKRIVEPPSAEKLKVIRDLVAGAVGFSQDRGDQLIVETLPFESTLNWTPPSATGAAPGMPDIPLPTWVPVWLRPQIESLMKQKIFLIIVGLLALFVLLLPVLAARMVLRRLRKKKPGVVTVATTKELPAAADGTPQVSQVAGGEQGDLSNQLQAKIAEQAVQKEKQALEAINALKLPQVTTKKTEVLARHISTEAKKDPAGMAQIVRTWLNETER